jgi:hypothetical protein
VVLAALALAALALAACAAGPPAGPGDAVPSPPPGPTVSGRILVFSAEARTVAEVRPGGTATLVEGAVAAALSPDGRSLAYATGRGELSVRTVDGDTERLVAVRRGGDTVAVAPGCLQWSPDGRRLSFFALPYGDLYVSTLDGVATRVEAVKRETYQETAGQFVIPRADPTGSTVELKAEVTCGRWLDERRLVFDRVAAMPGAVTLDEDERDAPVPADTTTVATLEPLRLVDSPDRWRVDDRCGEHVLTFVQGGDGGDRYVLRGDEIDDAALARPGAAAPVAGKLPRARAAFIDGPCDVLLLLGASTELHPTQRWTRATGQVQDLTPTFDADHNPFALDPDTVAFRPDGTAYAVADGGTLFLADLGTGGSIVASGAGQVTRVLGWLP